MLPWVGPRARSEEYGKGPEGETRRSLDLDIPDAEPEGWGDGARARRCLLEDRCRGRAPLQRRMLGRISLRVSQLNLLVSVAIVALAVNG